MATTRVWAAILAAAAAVFLTACSGHAVTETVVRKIVGPEGGVVLGPTGSKLIVPPNALQDRVEITLEQLTDADVRPMPIPDESGEPVPFLSRPRISIALHVGPEGIEFALPATVELSYNPREYSFSQQRNQIRAFMTPRFVLDWRMVEGSAEVEENVYRADTRSPGVFALFYFDAPPTDGDAVEQDRTDEACACDALIGDRCPADADCPAVARLTATVLSDSSCGVRIGIFGPQDNPLAQFDLAECADAADLPIEVEGLEGCRFTYDAASDVVTLDCVDCLAVLDTKACEGAPRKRENF
ncbi:MAG: hypothetical protein C4523_08230 [Myxococcales bacterium]|nr:MAG: hypothetical protein C4523_08230 [Myxococcales bacterium]